MTAAFVSVRGRFWRMLNIRFQTDPLSGEGAHADEGCGHVTDLAGKFRTRNRLSQE
jgi:hypothetical protein